MMISSVFFHAVTFRNILGDKIFLNSSEISLKCKSYVENKSDLLFIGTRYVPLRFSSVKNFAKNDFKFHAETLFR